MKSIFTGSILAVSLLCFSLCSEAQALTFLSTVSFPEAENPFTTVSYSASQNSGFFWEHDIQALAEGQVWESVNFQGGEIWLTYSRTHLDEQWSLEGIGVLESAFNPVTSTFQIGAEVFKTSGGLLSLQLEELTSGADSLRIYQSELKVNYDLPKDPAPSVPEPGSLVFGLTAFLAAFLQKLGGAFKMPKALDLG